MMLKFGDNAKNEENPLFVSESCVLANFALVKN